jgi:uncharacterized membrane protein (DUF485 family)
VSRVEHRDDGRPRTHQEQLYVDIQRSDQFQRLRGQLRRFVFPMTVVFLGWYLLYVISCGWARDFMSHELWGNINVAFVFGLLQFVSTFLIAWLYSRYMNRHIDPLADEIRHQIEGAS